MAAAEPAGTASCVPAFEQAAHPCARPPRSPHRETRHSPRPLDGRPFVRRLFPLNVAEARPKERHRERIVDDVAYMNGIGTGPLPLGSLRIER